MIRRWVVLDADGNVVGGGSRPEWQDKPLPEGAMEVFDDPARFRGKRWTGDEFHGDGLTDEVEAPEDVEFSLIQQAKEDAMEEVLRLCRVERLLHLTDLPGQDLLYEAKRVEAVAYMAEEIDPENFPLLTAEVEAARAETLHQAAQIVLYRAFAWRQIGAGMERLRYQTTDAIAVASSRADIAAALDVMRDAMASISHPTVQ